MPTTSSAKIIFEMNTFCNQETSNINKPLPCHPLFSPSNSDITYKNHTDQTLCILAKVLIIVALSILSIGMTSVGIAFAW